MLADKTRPAVNVRRLGILIVSANSGDGSVWFWEWKAHLSGEERDVALEASAIRDGVRGNEDEWKAVNIEF